MNTKKLKIMYNNFEHYSEIILVNIQDSMNDKLLKIKFGSLVREIKDFLNLDTEFDLKNYGI